MAKASMAFHNNGIAVGTSVVVIARKTTSLSVEEGRVVIASPVPINFNFTIEPLDPVFHRIFFYKSTDGGTTLGELISSTFDYDVKEEKISGERKFYVVDGPEAEDPVSGQDTITDPYLDGKSVIGVFSQGNRYLKQDIDYSLVPGGGIQLLNGVLFSPGEEISIEISYLNNNAGTYSPMADVGYKKITSSLTLDSTYDNCEVECSGGSSRLTVTLLDISAIPDGKWWSFHDYGQGSQYQTKIVTSGGDIIKWNGQSLTEIYIGKCEFGKIKKRGSFFQVTAGFEGMTHVGESVDMRVKPGFHYNILLEDDQPNNGDDYPRFFNWLTQKLGVNSKVTVATNGEVDSYDRAANPTKDGLIIVGPSRFRMPKTQGYYKKGLSDFITTGGVDADRPWNYSGGVAKGRPGKHRHPSPAYPPTDPKFSKSAAHLTPTWAATLVYVNSSSSTAINKKIDAAGDDTADDADTTEVNNIGYYFAIRI